MSDAQVVKWIAKQAAAVITLTKHEIIDQVLELASTRLLRVRRLHPIRFLLQARVLQQHKFPNKQESCWCQSSRC